MLYVEFIKTIKQVDLTHHWNAVVVVIIVIVMMKMKTDYGSTDQSRLFLEQSSLSSLPDFQSLPAASKLPTEPTFRLGWSFAWCFDRSSTTFCKNRRRWSQCDEYDCLTPVDHIRARSLEIGMSGTDVTEPLEVHKLRVFHDEMQGCLECNENNIKTNINHYHK